VGSLVPLPPGGTILRTRTTLIAASILAVDVLLGWLTIPLVSQEKKPEPDVKRARFT